MDHSIKVLETFEDLSKLLEDLEIEGAKRKLAEGVQLVNKRINTTKMGDKSEYGWATVAEYLSDELASDTLTTKSEYTDQSGEQKRSTKIANSSILFLHT